MQGAEGARFVSAHFPRGVNIEGGSVTMEKCTFTGRRIHVERGASLVMEDCRVFGCDGDGVNCEGGEVEATRCTFEGSGGDADGVLRQRRAQLGHAVPGRDRGAREGHPGP